MSFHPSKLKPLERALFIAGAALLGFAVITYAGGRLYSSWAVTRFHSGLASQTGGGAGESKSDSGVDFSLWAPKRIEAYKATLAEHFDNPLAVLKVDKIHLEVPVFEGTDEPILNRGAGRIIGTARIGDSGNVGIAAHRDGFFRGLKDVYVGDSLELETAHGTQTYAIDWIKVVDKDDVSVLRQEPASTLTLVTCYPFYFVGSAPQRYIVHASLKSETKTLNEPARASSQATASRTKENTQ